MSARKTLLTLQLTNHERSIFKVTQEKKKVYQQVSNMDFTGNILNNYYNVENFDNLVIKNQNKLGCSKYY